MLQSAREGSKGRTDKPGIKGVPGIYRSIAQFYDRLQDIDYKSMAGFIETLFDEYSIKPETVADLGCGTGRFCIEMCARGFDMIGVDISADMLSFAKASAVEKGMDILFINQDISELDLYGTVDAAVCLVDVINHITRLDKLKEVFRLVHNYLNPGGVFIFDVNTDYKLREVLGNNVFYSIDDDIAYIWQCRFNSPGISESDITVFAKTGSMYERFDGKILERAYSGGLLKEYIAHAGLLYLGTFDGETFKKPGKRSQRVFYVCRKEG